MLNKKSFLMIASGMLLAVAGSTQAALTDGMLGSYDADNASGNSLPNSVPGGPGITLAGGVSLGDSSNGTDKKLIFDGSDSFSPIAGGAMGAGSSAVTLEIWIEDLQDDGSWVGIVASMQGDNGYGFSRGRSSDYNVYASWTDQVNYQHGQGGLTKGTGTGVYNDPHQIVMVMDQNAAGTHELMTMYVDGVKNAHHGRMDGSQYNYDNFEVANGPGFFGIGGNWKWGDNVVGNHYAGSLLAVNIWGRGLSEEEVGASFDDGANGYVPEPASLALLTLGGLVALRRRR